MVDIASIERGGCPPGWACGWRARTSARQRHLQWMADKVEGNLLAAHQEIQKLGLLYPEASWPRGRGAPC